MWFKAGWTVARPNGWAHGARYCQHMLLDIIELSQWCWLEKRGGGDGHKESPPVQVACNFMLPQIMFLCGKAVRT